MAGILALLIVVLTNLSDWWVAINELWGGFLQ